ncbi:MAG: phage integrase N-terminal SAM-like domain-containing protein [Betaproteobacteria bacterium]|nr:phage integrase N-terminal SAM-like domain-containing protein [Betaproteobacteria bacterium]
MSDPTPFSVSGKATAGPAAPKLLDLLRERIRLRHYSIRTETQYVHWAKRFILFHGKRHPSGMGAPEVEAFLTHLAVEGQVAASTQNQALSCRPCCFCTARCSARICPGCKTWCVPNDQTACRWCSRPAK